MTCLTCVVSRRALVFFVALGLVWGVPYLLIKYAVATFTPATLVMLRTAIGGLVLLPVAVRAGALPAVLRRWKAVSAYTVVEIIVPWLALSHAETALPSGLAALLIAAVPVAGLAISALAGRPERLGPGGWCGMALGIGGVALLAGREALAPSGPGVGLALAEMLLVVIGYALGPQIIATRLADVPNSGVIVASLLGPAVVLAPVGIAQWPAHVDAPAAISVVLLGLVCTALAFLLLFELVAEVGPVRTTVITYINPAVAVVAGAVFLAEPVTVATIAGFVAIVGGSVLVQRRPRTLPAVPSGPEPA